MDKKLSNSLFLMVLIVYLFFSVVATKMTAFPTVVSSLIFISLATLFIQTFEYIKKFVSSETIRNSLFVIFIICIVGFRFKVENLQKTHTTWKNNPYTLIHSHNKEVFKSLKLPVNSVLFNVPGRHYIEAMFYTDYTAYNFIPDSIQYQELMKKKRHIAIFTNGNLLLPDYLKNDSSITMINRTIQGIE
jgi:hypothetical protein